MDLNQSQRLAVLSNLIGVLFGYGLGLLVAITVFVLPRDPFGFEPSFLASVPAIHILAFGAAFSILCATAISAKKGPKYLKKIEA